MIKIDLFNNKTEVLTIKQQKRLKRKIERAKLPKLGTANYFYPTTGKNCYHTDGFVIGVNGKSEGGGFTVFLNGKHLVTERRNKKLITNNETELLGVVEALKDAEEGDEIITDSMNTLAWIRSGNPKARPDLKTLASEGKKLLHSKKINLYWEKRDNNLAGNYNEFVLFY